MYRQAVHLMDKQTDFWTDRNIYKHTDRSICRQTDISANRTSYGQTGRLIKSLRHTGWQNNQASYGQIDQLMDKQSDLQTDLLTDRTLYRQTEHAMVQQNKIRINRMSHIETGVLTDKRTDLWTNRKLDAALKGDLQVNKYISLLSRPRNRVASDDL